MTDERRFYRVLPYTWNMRLPDNLEQGYEDRQDFERAVRRLADRWHDRIGECVGERNGFLLLRFHDTPGGVADEEWLPPYLLVPADAPEIQDADEGSSDSTEAEITEAFGFD